MNRLALAVVAALLAAVPALGGPADDAAYARLRGDAQNLLTQARALAFDGLTGAPNLLGQMQTVATSLKGLEGNAEAQALAGQLSGLHQELQRQVDGQGDQAKGQRPDAQREAVKAFRAKAGEITSLAQRAVTLAQPNSAAWPQPGQERQAVGHPIEVASAGNALPLATRNVGRGLDAYGGLAGSPTAFDDRFGGVPQGPSPRSAWNPAAEDAKLHDALAQLPAATRQDLSRSAHPAPGNEVLVQQRAINAARRQQGLAPITEDGRFGAQTQSAVCAMQKGHACSAKELREQGSGVIDQQTSDKIALAAARAGDNAGLPKLGDHGSEDVRRLQRALNAKGAHLKVDGDYGAGTEKALARLTGRRSLDHKTWDDLTKAKDTPTQWSDALLPRPRPAAADAQAQAQPPALPQADPRDARRGLATVYDRRQGGPMDAHDRPLCTMESYAVGGCQAGQPITIASHAVRKGKGYVPTHDGEVVQSQALETYYTQYCASLGERCVNRTPRFVVSDSCPGCRMPDHVDLAREPGAPEIKMPIDIQFVRFREGQ